MQAYLQHDIAFHQTILEASGNEMLAALAPVVAEVLNGRIRHALMPAQPAPTAIRRHMLICDAVQSRMPEDAEAAMRAIVVEANAVTRPKLSGSSAALVVRAAPGEESSDNLPRRRRPNSITTPASAGSSGCRSRNWESTSAAGMK